MGRTRPLSPLGQPCWAPGSALGLHALRTWLLPEETLGERLGRSGQEAFKSLVLTPMKRSAHLPVGYTLCILSGW